MDADGRFLVNAVAATLEVRAASRHSTQRPCTAESKVKSQDDAVGLWSACKCARTCRRATRLDPTSINTLARPWSRSALHALRRRPRLVRSALSLGVLSTNVRHSSDSADAERPPHYLPFALSSLPSAAAAAVCHVLHRDAAHA